ncbi:MAG: hypothetical protein ABR521_03580 [Gaiellaceae bacterium]
MKRRHPGSSRARAIALGCLIALGAGATAPILLLRSGEGLQPAAAASPHPVAGGFEPDRTRLEDCGPDQACLEQAFGNLAFRRGPSAALRTFDAKMGSDAAVESGCHRIAHLIGSAALARYRGDVGRAFSEGSASCWSGYYHGILERAFAGASGESQVIATARRLCAGRDVRRTEWLAYQCVHGLGHGLMLRSAYALPFSLRVCDRLPTAWDRSSCSGGVFMENINGAEKTAYGFKSRWLRDGDLVYPCNAVQERHKLYCYLMVTSRILQAHGYDWRAAARICAGVERGWVATCFQSLGRDASGFSRQDPSRILTLCAHAGARASDCLYGAARDVTSNDANGDRAARLCERAPVESRLDCFSGIGTILGSLVGTTEARRAACARLTRVYLRTCVRGAGG